MVKDFSQWRTGDDSGRNRDADTLVSLQRKAQYFTSVKINKGRRIVHGVVAKADCLTSNSRIYPQAVLKREVSFYQRHIKKGTGVGELDHPNYSSPYFKHLTFAAVSHRILELRWKGSCLMGIIEILPTASGVLLWDLYAHGLTVGASLRGWSSMLKVNSSKCYIVQDDFHLVTFDLVPVPAFPEGYMAPLLKRYKGNLVDSTSILQLCAVGYGAVLPRSLTDADNPLDILSVLKQHHRQLNAAIKGHLESAQQEDIRSTWCEKGCCVVPGSYITQKDAASKYLKENVPGTRDISAHFCKYCAKAFKNNGVSVNSKEIVGLVLRCLSRDVLASAMEEVRKNVELDQSCWYAWKPIALKATRFLSRNLHSQSASSRH